MSSMSETAALESGMENLEDLYELSPMQQGMLFHTLYEPESGAYFEQSVSTIRGDLDVPAFESAWNTIVQRHSILRTSFLWHEIEKPLQIVHRRVELPFDKHDWRHLSFTARQEKLEAYIIADRQRGFDLATAPLMRLALFRFAEDEYKFMFSRHHLVLDRWSRSLLLKELFILYQATSKGRRPDLSPTRPYGDYIAWLLRQDSAAAEVYWKESLTGFTAPTPLGCDKRPDGTVTGELRFQSESLPLSEDATVALNAFARRHKLTLNTVAQGAWAFLLMRYSGQDDVLFGVTVAGRPADLPGVESMIGLFLNTLPQRVRVRSEETVVSWLLHLQGQQADLRQFEYSSLLDIQGWSDVPRGVPLFESIFIFENLPVDASFRTPNAEIQIQDDRNYGSTTGYPLTVMIEPGSKLTIHCVYDSARFDAPAVRRMLSHLETVLKGIATGGTQGLRELPLLTPPERRQILVDWNSTQAGYEKELCIHQGFERQAALTPDAVAVVYEEQQMKFAELNARSNQLAHYLRQRGVGVESLVGIYIERSPSMIVALLGVLKAGGAYVPLDPSYPTDRIALIIEDSRVPLVLTRDHLLESLPAAETEVVSLDSICQEITCQSTANPDSGSTSGNAAHVLYTSGSTGRPKGVLSPHRASLNRFEWMWRTYPFATHEICCQKTALSFTDSIWETFGPLLKGIPLVIVPDDAARDPQLLVDVLSANKVTRIVLVPSLLRVILESTDDLDQRLSGLRYWTCSGEALPVELAQLFKQKLPGRSLINLYGSSEVAADVTRYEVNDTAQLSNIPIGRPIANTAAYVLDSQLEPVPVGVTGSLYIAGAGLARGYLGRGELTAQTFLPNPFSDEPGARMYGSGDFVRYQEDGTIEYVGRRDHQVKLRGFRIELGEIEVALKEHPAVSDVVVMAAEPTKGDVGLVGYVVTHSELAAGYDGKLAGQLRVFLKDRLPDYMVPRAFVLLDKFPLTPSGKINRLALPAADFSLIESTNEFVGPRNPQEDLLAGIWSKVLGVERVGIRDNFFDLGGHSLLATQVMSRVREAFHVELPLRLLFESPTVAALAESIDRALQDEQGLQLPPLVAVSRQEDLPVSFAQQRLWFLDQLEQGSSFYNISRTIRLQGIPNITALSEAISEVVRRHESLRTAFVSLGGMPFQRIAEAESVIVPLIDLQRLPGTDRENEARTLAAAEIQKPFDLSRGPLFRACLIKVAEDEHILVLTMPHIAGDAWSLAILFRELTILYEAFARGEPSPLPELAIQYADFAVWQRKWLQGEMLERHLSYWRQQLAGAPTVLELPSDRPRPEVQTFRGARLPMALSPELTQLLKNLGRSEGTTLFMICMAAFQLLLSRYTGQKDLIIGTDVANRNRVETEGMIGFFVNLLPLRINLAGNPSFTDLLKRAREVTLGAYTHQELPFEKLVEELRPERDLSRNPLVQILLVMQNAPAHRLQMSGLDLSPFELPTETSRFDLALFLWEQDNELRGGWLYNSDLFDASTILRMSGHFTTLLENIVRDPASPLDSFAMITDEEAKREIMEKSERHQSQMSRLRTTRRRSVDLSDVRGIKTSYLQPGETLPLIVEPDSEDVDLPEWADHHKEFIENNLLKHGAMLFRGFHIESISEFEKFAAAVCPDLFGEYGDLPRAEVGGKVYGSTPYPSDAVILFHNESSHMHCWPMLIWFCCVKAAEQGGETPIVDCRRIYQDMDPAMRDKFEEKGLMYVRNFTEGLDVSWQDFFHTSDRAVVEDYCRRASIEFEWKGDNTLQTRKARPAVVTHPQTGEKVFFNQLQLHHVSCLEPAVRESLLSMMKEEDLPRNVYYGDGSVIEDSVMDDLLKLYWKTAVSFPWQERDVLMVNNMLVAHARKVYAGQRKIVVAMGNMIDNGR